MSTHHAEFMKRLDEGGSPNIYSMQPEGKNYFRLYDGNSFFGGNYKHHACIASKLSEAQATAAVNLAKNNPKQFADEWL